MWTVLIRSDIILTSDFLYFLEFTEKTQICLIPSVILFDNKIVFLSSKILINIIL